MTKMGWAFLIVTWSVLSYWTVWCLYKVLTAPFDEEQPPHTP